jgi:hypothetical protein
MRWYLLPLTLLAACGGHPKSAPEPLVVVREVNIPVVGTCVPSSLGDAPDYADTDAALKSAPDGAVRYQLLFAGRGQRTARLNELEPVVKGCPKAN